MRSVVSAGFDFTQIFESPTAADADNVTLSLPGTLAASNG